MDVEHSDDFFIGLLQTTTGGIDDTDTEVATPKLKKLLRKQTQYPSRNTKYVRYSMDGPSMHCHSRGCKAPTNAKVQGIPYCTLHREFALAQIIERLETLLQAKG